MIQEHYYAKYVQICTLLDDTVPS